jgi:hypothetical protein
VGLPRGLDSAYCRVQCLRQNLAAKYPEWQAGTSADEQVLVNLFDLQVTQQFVEIGCQDILSVMCG